MQRSFTFVLLLVVCLVFSGRWPRRMRPRRSPSACAPMRRNMPHGPYWVGTQTLEMETTDGEPIRYTVWYPALNPDGLPEAVEYVMSDNHVLRTDLGSRRMSHLR